MVDIASGLELRRGFSAAPARFGSTLESSSWNVRHSELMLIRRSLQMEKFSVMRKKARGGVERLGKKEGVMEGGGEAVSFT
eukprot:3935545-Rhodomonas_salina.12